MDARADVYSLGCILYHLLTGQVPFDAPQSSRAVGAVNDEIPAVSDVGASCP